MLSVLRILDLWVSYLCIVSDFKKELRLLNRELQLHFLELADVLVERPSQYARRVEEISLIFKNLHHLLNSLRPHQVRNLHQLIVFAAVFPSYKLPCSLGPSNNNSHTGTSNTTSQTSCWGYQEVHHLLICLDKISNTSLISEYSLFLSN